MARLRFGFLSFATEPYADLARRFRAVEELGFDCAWADDGVRTEYADFEPWTLLAALARETTRLRLRTLVASVVHRHPTFLAGQAVTLDHLSGGRAELGLGAGGPSHPRVPPCPGREDRG